MAAKRNMHSYEGAYVHGNTVRKAEPSRVPVRRTPDEVRRPSVNHNIRRNREKALQMDLPYVIMLTIAAICSLCLCVNYLHMQSSITSRINDIANKEQHLETLRSENNALETRINTYVDLDHVYQVATEELGMVYANKNQVILYNQTESEYVRQYEDIPKH